MKNYSKIKFNLKRNSDFLTLLKESELEKKTIIGLIVLTILLGISELLFISLIAIFTNAIINGEVPKNLILNNNFLSSILNSNFTILIFLITSFIFRSVLLSFKTFYISRVNGNVRKVFRIKILKNFLNKTIKSGIYSGKIFDMYFQSSATSSKVIINFVDLIINILFSPYSLDTP